MWFKSFILQKGEEKNPTKILEWHNQSCVSFLFRGRLEVLKQQHVSLSMS